MTKGRLTVREKWRQRRFSKGVYFREIGTYEDDSMTKGDQNWMQNSILVF